MVSDYSSRPRRPASVYGIFKITGESSIASGVRRIEALTGATAKEWVVREKENEAKRLKLDGEKEELKKAFGERLKIKLAEAEKIVSAAPGIGASKAVIDIVDGLDMDGLRILSDKIRDIAKSAVVILATKDSEKAAFIISITEDLVKKGLNAGVLAKELAGMIEGSGGGRPNFSQGGGKKSEKLEEALNNVLRTISDRLK